VSTTQPSNPVDEVEAYTRETYASMRSKVLVMGVIGIAALAAAIALRAWGLVAERSSGVDVAARYAPIPAAVIFFLASIFFGKMRRRSSGRPEDEIDRQYCVMIRYYSAVVFASSCLMMGAVVEAVAYWLEGPVVALPLSVVLIAGLAWWFPTPDRLARAVEDAGADLLP
jgi:hypothetical protein